MSSIQTIPLRIAGQEIDCPLYVGGGLRHQILDLLQTHGLAQKIFIVADQNIPQDLQAGITKPLKSHAKGLHIFQRTFEEKQKNLQTVQELYQELIQGGIDRSSLIIALGGGVVGDLVGFIAATLFRGVPFVQIPSTLLAQVDASIGGKVGVNFGETKNIVGSFYMPQFIVIDPEFCRSLPERQMWNGFVEVMKYGIILDEKLFTDMAKELTHQPSADSLSRIHWIQRCAELKAHIVVEDFKESGKRAILNFGHTLGHALEMCCHDLYHGEAVAIGMRFALHLSHQKGLCAQAEVDRVTYLLDLLPSRYLPKSLPDFSQVWDKMLKDKKRFDGRLKMVFMKKLGVVELGEVSEKEVKELYLNQGIWWRKQ